MRGKTVKIREGRVTTVAQWIENLTAAAQATIEARIWSLARYNRLKNLVLHGCSAEPWLGFNRRLRDFHMLQVQPLKKKKQKTHGPVGWGEERDMREQVQNQTNQKLLGGNFLSRSLKEWPHWWDSGRQTEISKAWNSVSNQDSDARQLVKLPPPRLDSQSLSEDRLCRHPPDTRPTPQSHSTV